MTATASDAADTVEEGPIEMYKFTLGWEQLDNVPEDELLSRPFALMSTRPTFCAGDGRNYWIILK
jgi:hypothetical protein